MLSSQIEGTQFVLSDPLRFETEVRAGEPMDEIRDVSNDVDAVIHSLDRPHQTPAVVTAVAAQWTGTGSKALIISAVPGIGLAEHDVVATLFGHYPSTNWRAVLVHLGVLKETTGRRRGRVFAYGLYPATLNEKAPIPYPQGNDHNPSMVDTGFEPVTSSV